MTGGIITLQRDGVAFTLPVNPPSIPIKRGRNYHEVDIIGYRTVGRLGNTRLTELSISETFFPAYYDSSYCNYSNLMSPWNSAVLLTQWCEGAGPVFVTISGASFNEWMQIVDFATEDKAGEPGDVYYSMTLKSWWPTTVTLFQEQPRPPGPQAPSVGSRTYTVKSGDNLWNIAKKFYGNGALWPRIYDANRAVIGRNPNLIFPGQVYVIP